MANKVKDFYDNTAENYDKKWDKFSTFTHSLVIDQLDDTKELKVLDFGCGTGLLLEKLAEEKSDAVLIGVDISPKMLSLAKKRLDKKRVTLKQLTSKKLPLPRSSIDVVLSVSNLHHLDTPTKYLQEFERVLRPGGVLIILDWCTDFFWQRLGSY